MCPTRWCGPTWPNDDQISASSVAAVRPGCLCPRRICPAEKPRSISAKSVCDCTANSSPATCSRCECHTPAKLFTEHRQPVGRKRFSRAMHAFEVLGGVPAGKVRYDNLKAAVAQVIGFSRQRVETDRWVAFRSHFDLDAFYCQPGVTGAHEKGGVEGDIGRFRRNHLVPVPAIMSLRELNELIDDYDRADDDRRIGHRAHTVAESFSAERQLLKPLPVEPFETGLWLTPRVDRYSQITVRTNRYSVPSRLIGRQVRVLLNASDLTVYDGRTPVATHERLLTKGGSRVDLDHYLEALVRKPGALPGATALEQARTAGTFTTAHDARWAAACKAHGDTAGTRALIEVLLLHRHANQRDVVAGITAALQAGALTADAVALEARKAADTTEGATAPVSPPTQTRLR